MKMARKLNELHVIPGFLSTLPLVILVLALITVATAKLPLWTALAFAFTVAYSIARFSGFPSENLGVVALSGMKKVSRVVILMALINIAISTWLGSGSVQALVYYGLRAVKPGSLLIAGFVTSTVVSIVLGTAVGTLSTVGVAAVAMARAAGVRPELVAGSLLSGALLGDRLSPLSPIFHVTLQSTGSSQERVWKKVVATDGTAWILTLAVYFAVQTRIQAAAPTSVAAQSSFLKGMAEMWSPSPIACLPPFLVLILAVFRIPVVLALTGGIAAGTWLSLSQGIPWSQIVSWSVKGFSAQTGIANLDRAFSGGGLARASNVVLLLLFAGAFNGIMENTGMFQRVTEPIVERLRTRKEALLGTMALSAASACVMSNQLMSIMVPAELTQDIRCSLKIEPEATARILLASGGVISPLIPWNIMGVMSSETLGLPTTSFAPFTFYPLMVVILTASCAASGLLCGSFRRTRPETF